MDERKTELRGTLYEFDVYLQSTLYHLEKAKTLGIIFTNDSNAVHELNLEPKIAQFKHTLLTWKKWKLSLIGKRHFKVLIERKIFT